VPTDTVPLKQGIGFGFRWTASGFSSRERVVVTYRISHPPITRPDGKTLRGFTEDLPYDAPGGEIETTDCYFLSERHELVAGEWELAIVYRGKELVLSALRWWLVVRANCALLTDDSSSLRCAYGAAQRGRPAGA
jgi:hypothetical protein